MVAEADSSILGSAVKVPAEMMEGRQLAGTGRFELPTAVLRFLRRFTVSYRDVPRSRYLWGFHGVSLVGNVTAIHH
jgi:hypothetical protein